MQQLISATGMSQGDQALVTATNNLYIYAGSGWFKIATVQNNSPTPITGVDSNYTLAVDGTATTITAASTDPEGFPITFGFSTSGLGSIATVSQDSSVFTITPTTNTSNGGTFTLTITATDNVNGAINFPSNFSLTFQVTVTNSKYTSALVTAVGTSDNNNITDASSNSHSLTISGNTSASSFSPYRHPGYSLKFSNQYARIAVAENSTTRVLGNNFTVEGWIYVTGGNTGLRTIIAQGKSGVYSPFNVYYDSSTSKFVIDLSSTGSSWNIASQVASANTYSENEWHHWALVRDGSSFKLYANGSLDSTIATSSATLMTPTVQTGIGAREGSNAQYNFYGYMKDLRLVIGTAVYSGSSYTVPTELLEDITNTKLLLCASPSIEDKSSNNLTVYRRLGDLSNRPFSPYDNVEYTVADHGGSIYFDGTGDYITIPTLGNSSVTNFTISFWMYSESFDVNTSLYPRVLSIGDGSSASTFILYLNTSRVLNLYTGGAVRIESVTGSGAVMKTNVWQHIVLKRNSGTWRLLVDGVSQGTYSNSTGINFTSNMFLGKNTTAAGYYTGNISDFKIEFSSTSASTATVPTSPTSSTGAELHIKGTDASIIDKAQKNNTILNGNTTGSTTQAKFSAKSMYFDGTDDYISMGDFESLPGDFTMEAWVYMTSVAAEGIVCRGRNTAGGHLWYIENGVMKFRGYNSSGSMYGSDIAINAVLGTNTWYHLAVTRSGSTIRMFINGVLNANTGTMSPTNVPMNSTADMEIGGYTYSGSHVLPFSGYMQDVRITKGLARYTSSFTAPSASLEG